MFSTHSVCFLFLSTWFIHHWDYSFSLLLGFWYVLLPFLSLANGRCQALCELLWRREYVNCPLIMEAKYEAQNENLKWRLYQTNNQCWSMCVNSANFLYTYFTKVCRTAELDNSIDAKRVEILNKLFLVIFSGPNCLYHTNGNGIIIGFWFPPNLLGKFKVYFLSLLLLLMSWKRVFATLSRTTIKRKEKTGVKPSCHIRFFHAFSKFLHWLHWHTVHTWTNKTTSKMQLCVISHAQTGCVNTR